MNKEYNFDELVKYYTQYEREDPPSTLIGGDKHWVTRFNLFHRDNDRPAIITNETMQWYRDGFLHRTDGPAIINQDGELAWYVDNKLHREDNLPAIYTGDNRNQYFVNGVLHRTDGPAKIDKGMYVDNSTGEMKLMTLLYWFNNGECIYTKTLHKHFIDLFINNDD